jgi:hypothetical protein
MQLEGSTRCQTRTRGARIGNFGFRVPEAALGVRLHPLRRWPEARLLGGGSAAAAAASSCAQNCARAQSAPGLALATATRCKPRRREAAATAPCENANPATGSLIVTPPKQRAGPAFK